MGRTKRFDIALKRVYDVPSETDGRRILVERLWPRGLWKDKASIHHWLKEIAPITDTTSARPGLSRVKPALS